MPTTCGFPNCKFRSRYRGQEDNRHFYRIPKRPPQLRQRWLKAIGRTEETIVSQLRICSAHFAGGEKKEGDIPVPDPQFDPPLFIILPPRGEALRYATAEQRQQRLLAKRLKMLNKNQYGLNSTNSANRRQRNRVIREETNLDDTFNGNQLPDKDASNVKFSKNSKNSKCSKFIDRLFDAAYPVAHLTPTSDDSANNGGNSSDISPGLASSLSQRLIRVFSPNQPHNCPAFFQFFGMNKSFHGLPYSHHGMPFHGLSATSTATGPIPTSATGAVASARPLVALLDGRDCTIEMPLLKDIATVAFCDAQSTAEIHEKVLNEAVVAFLYHSISLSREDLLKFKALKVVVRIGSGYHNVDVNAATDLGIAICNTPVECVEETADTALLFILNMFRKTFWLSRINQTNVRQSYNVEQLRELATGCTRIRGSTLGLVGLGRVGIAVAMRARAFGLNVIFYDPHVAIGIEKSLDIERCETLADILKRSDCVSLHCPLNAETRLMLNADTIPKMKYGAFLVNTSAPDLIAVSILLSALRSGHIRAAAFEKCERDAASFNDTDNAFFEALCQMPNVICTPHCAWYSDESSKELRTAAAKEIRRALVGHFPEDLTNCVNKEALLARAATLNGLLPGGAPGIQELAAAALGLNAVSSAGSGADALGKVNLAAILSQNGGGPTANNNALFSTATAPARAINGRNGAASVTKSSTSTVNATNPMLLSGLNIADLASAAGGDNADMVEQLNNLMTQFGSIPPEALSGLAAISATPAADMIPTNNTLTAPLDNASYQNFLMSLNPQMFLNTSQNLVGNTTNNSHQNSGAAPTGSSFEIGGSTPLASSSAAVTTCGGGSGRSSVSQSSAPGGSTFDGRALPIGSAAIKRKDSNSPSFLTTATPAKISALSSRQPISTSAAYTDHMEDSAQIKTEPVTSSDTKPAKDGPSISERGESTKAEPIDQQHNNEAIAVDNDNNEFYGEASRDPLTE